MANPDDSLHDATETDSVLAAVRAEFYASDVTLTDALRAAGFTHRPAANQLLIGAREIVNGAGVVVFTGRAGATWDWLTRIVADERRDNDVDEAADECPTCRGTGIGQHGDPDTSVCGTCGGSGGASLASQRQRAAEERADRGDDD